MIVIRKIMEDEYGEAIFLPTCDCLKGIINTMKFGIIIVASAVLDLWVLKNPVVETTVNPPLFNLILSN